MEGGLEEECEIFVLFKQKTTYEFTACLVGSEMYIGDSHERSELNRNQS